MAVAIFEFRAANLFKATNQSEAEVCQWLILIGLDCSDFEHCFVLGCSLWSTFAVSKSFLDLLQQTLATKNIMRVAMHLFHSNWYEEWLFYQHNSWQQNGTKICEMVQKYYYKDLD